MSIEKHVFLDDDVTLRRSFDNMIELTCVVDYEFDYIEMHRDDAIALAKHFKLTQEDLE